MLAWDPSTAVRAQANQNQAPSSPPVKKTVVGKALVLQLEIEWKYDRVGRENFHADANTAATNVLPLGSSARVTNLEEWKGKPESK